MKYAECIQQESISQSTFSPSIVLNEESIARVLFYPKHYKDGEVSATAFTQIFDPDGFSVLRLSHKFEESLEKTVEIIEEDSPSKYAGYVYASVQDIREIVENCFRVFYILDTARADRVAHADIYAIRLHKEMGIQKKFLTNFIRSEIADVFNKYNK